jgi:cell division protease FtsH
VTTILSWVLPALLFVGVWILAIRRMAVGKGGAGLLTVGKRKARVYLEKQTGVSTTSLSVIDGGQRRREAVLLNKMFSFGIQGPMPAPDDCLLDD